MNNKAILFPLQLISFLLHLFTPIAALFIVGQETEVSAWLMSFSMFFVLLPWCLVFVLFQQIRYPNKILPALWLTGFSIAQYVVFALSGSLLISAYLYFFSTLIALAGLFLLMAPYLLLTKKHPGYKDWNTYRWRIALGFFFWSLFTLFFAHTIQAPLLQQLQTSSSGIVFVVFTCAQIISILLFQAKNFTAPISHKTSELLPDWLVVSGVCVAVLLSGIAAFIS